MDMQKTAAFIATKRKEKNLTQRQLAQLLNVSDKTVSKWETAKGMPDISIISSLCDSLEITPTEFFMGENVQDSESLIIEVADSYHRMGKKRMVCFFSFIIAVLFIVVGSFFGDGFPKIVTTITAYAVSGISAYKLGKISMDELKNLQKIALIILAATVIMA